MNTSIFSLSTVIPAFSAGVMSQVVGHPFLAIATRQSVHHGTKFSSVFHIISETVRNEGVLALYKGAAIPMFSSGIINAFTFSFYEHLKKTTFAPKKQQDGSHYNNEDILADAKSMFLSGTLTGFSSAFIYAPYDIIRTKLILQYTTNERTGPIKELKSMISTPNPLKSIFRQLPIQILQQSIPCGFYFGVHDLFAKYIKSIEKQPETAPIFLQFLKGKDFSVFGGLVGGVLSGFGYWLTAMPFFSVKTRQAYDPITYPTIRSTSSHIYSKYGLSGFYKGISPVLLRSIPTYGAVFLTYDFLRSLFP